MDRLHDWTLIGVEFEWATARASIEFEDVGATRRTLTAEHVRLLQIPMENEWGPSVSVNVATEEPAPNGEGCVLCIEMQSGDVIRVWAAKMVMT